MMMIAKADTRKNIQAYTSFTMHCSEKKNSMEKINIVRSDIFVPLE